MLTQSRILGVSGNTINLTPHTSSQLGLVKSSGRGYRTGYTDNKEVVNQVTASLSTTGAGGSNLSVNGFWQSNYQYYMTGLLPADPNLIDTATLALFYRDIYLFDNTAGSAVDIMSRFPFSSWKLRGLESKELEPFEEALEQLNIQTMMPLISTAHLVDGYFCGSLVFNPGTKQFIDTLIHDALSCAVIPSPFYGIDPTINVRVGQSAQQFMHDTSEYARQYMNQMPRQFIEMLKSGAFTLDPVTTWFVPRRSTTDRAYTSYMHRILPMYLIEKTLFRGTLTEAQRRQRAMTHLTAGDDQWTPTTEELGELVHMFQQAEYDPLGGWVSTRNAVQAVDIRPGGDFWKWTDMADILVPYKLRALGISESFLSGEASYAAAESAYSTFLESMNSYRVDLTERVFYSKLFPLIAVVNGMYKDPGLGRAKSGKILDFLFNRRNRNNLKMPQLHWDKELEAKGEENMAELLEHASEKGVPIPLKMWMAAAKIDPEALIRDLEEDKELRKRLEKYTGKDTSHDAEEADEFSEEYEDDERGDFHSASAHAAPGFTTQSIRNLVRNPRVPLLARDWGDSGDSFTLTKTGKLKHTPSAFTAEKRARAHDQIMSISRNVDKDPNYRATLAKRNQEKLGRTTLPGLDPKKRG